MKRNDAEKDELPLTRAIKWCETGNVMAVLKMLVTRRNERRPEKSELLADRPKTANRPDVCRVVFRGVKVAKFVGVFPQHFFLSPKSMESR